MITFDQQQHLRTVRFEGYTLTTWETNRTRQRHALVGYRLVSPTGEILFEGEDFGCSPLHCVDSDEALRSLLGFLCLRPGDTDAEYFANYTEAQLAFAENEAESLSLYAEEEDPLPFEDVE